MITIFAGKDSGGPTMPITLVRNTKHGSLWADADGRFWQCDVPDDFPVREGLAGYMCMANMKLVPTVSRA